MRSDGRLAALQAAVIVWNVLGAWTAVVLVDLGISRAGAASVLAAMPAIVLVMAPVWGSMADHDGRRVAWLRRLTLTTAVCGSALLWLDHAAAFVVLLLAATAARAGQAPLLDAETLHQLGPRRDAYGRLRAAGSVSFVAAMLVAGFARDLWPRAPYLLPVLGAWAGVALLWRMPESEPDASVPMAPPTLAVLRAPRLALLTGAAFLHGLGLTAYDALFPMLIEDRGLPSWVAGAAMGGGVAVEVGLLLTGVFWLRVVGAERLLLVSLAVGAPRWFLTGTLTDPAALVLLQACQGLSFGGFWLAATRLFADLAPPGAATRAQALLGAVTFGLSATTSMSLATWWLGEGDVASLLRALAVAPVAATLLAAWAVRPR